MLLLYCWHIFHIKFVMLKVIFNIKWVDQKEKWLQATAYEK